MTQKSWVKAGPLVFEQSLRRVRVEIGGIAVADSTRVLWLWEEGKVLPLYLFPSDDARTDLLRPSEHPLPEAHHGLASYFTLEVDGRVAENAAWTYSAAPAARERGSQTTWPSIGERWTPGTRRRSGFSRTRATRTRAFYPGELSPRAGGPGRRNSRRHR